MVMKWLRASVAPFLFARGGKALLSPFTLAPCSFRSSSITGVKCGRKCPPDYMSPGNPRGGLGRNWRTRQSSFLQLKNVAADEDDEIPPNTASFVFSRPVKIQVLEICV